MMSMAVEFEELFAAVNSEGAELEEELEEEEEEEFEEEEEEEFDDEAE